MALHLVPPPERFTSQELLYLATACRLLALDAETDPDLKMAGVYRELAAKCERMAALERSAQS